MDFKTYSEIKIETLEEKTNNDIFQNRPILFESPMYYDGEFFDRFNDVEYNHEWAINNKILENFIGLVKIYKTEYKLYRINHEGLIWDFYISGKSPFELISAFVKYKNTNNEMLLEGVWQIDTVLGLIRSLIIEYYMPKFNAIISGAITNNKGKIFLQNLAKEFVKLGKSVKLLINNKEYSYEFDKQEDYWKSSNGISNIDKRIKYSN